MQTCVTVVFSCVFSCIFSCGLLADSPTPPKGHPLALLPEAQWNTRTAAHLLDRAGFGGTPEQIGELAELTPREAVGRILNFQRVAEDPRLNEFKIKPFHPTPFKDPKNPTYEERLGRFFGFIAHDRQQIRDARVWWLERMLLTEHPLREKMVLFWHGHFTSSSADKYMSALMVRQNELFRRHGIGNFHELTLAVSKDPAMLRYLNNNANVKGRPNENYARELMELFTMGEGNYTEHDIKESARALTGWTLVESEFVFKRQLHDDGKKTFLGRSGDFDGTDVVRVIMEQPETAEFLAGKLFRFFAHDHPPAAVTRGLAATLRNGGYLLKPMLRRLFLSREFYSERSMNSLIKSPTDLMVSTWRMLGLEEVPMPGHVEQDMMEMGQLLFSPPTVKGWDGGRAWLTSSTLLTRYNYVGRLLLGAEVDPPRPLFMLPPAMDWLPVAIGEGSLAAQFSAVSLVRDSPDAVLALERHFLRPPLPETRRAEVVKFLEANSFDIEKPEAENLLRRALHLMLCTPEYQVE